MRRINSTNSDITLSSGINGISINSNIPKFFWAKVTGNTTVTIDGNTVYLHSFESIQPNYKDNGLKYETVPDGLVGRLTPTIRNPLISPTFQQLTTNKQYLAKFRTTSKDYGAIYEIVGASTESTTPPPVPLGLKYKFVVSSYDTDPSATPSIDGWSCCFCDVFSQNATEGIYNVEVEDLDHYAVFARTYATDASSGRPPLEIGQSFYANALSWTDVPNSIGYHFVDDNISGNWQFETAEAIAPETAGDCIILDNDMAWRSNAANPVQAYNPFEIGLNQYKRGVLTWTGNRFVILNVQCSPTFPSTTTPAP